MKSHFYFLFFFILSCADSTHRIQVDNSSNELKNLAASSDAPNESTDSNEQPDIQIQLDVKNIGNEVYGQPAPMKEFLCQELVDEKVTKQDTPTLYLRLKINNGSLDCTLMNLRPPMPSKTMAERLVSLGTRACQFLTYDKQDPNEYYVETIKNPDELALVIIYNAEKNGYFGKGKLLYEYTTGLVQKEFKIHQFSCLIPDEKVKTSVLWTAELK